MEFPQEIEFGVTVKEVHRLEMDRKIEPERDGHGIICSSIGVFGRLINGNSIIVASVSGLALVLHGPRDGGGFDSKKRKDMMDLYTT